MSLRPRHCQDFELSGAEKGLSLRDIGHAGNGERSAQLIGSQRFARQQKANVGQVVFVAARHLGEDEVECGRAEDGQASKFQRNSDAAAQPVRGENDFQFEKQVCEVETFRFELGVGALLSFPEVQVLVFGSKPREREDGIDVLRGGEGGGTGGVAECQGGAAEESDVRRRDQVVVERLEDAQRIIHGGRASRFAVGRRVGSRRCD